MYYHWKGTLIDRKQTAYWVRLSYENECESVKKALKELEFYKYEASTPYLHLSNTMKHCFLYKERRVNQ